MFLPNDYNQRQIYQKFKRNIIVTNFILKNQQLISNNLKWHYLILNYSKLRIKYNKKTTLSNSKLLSRTHLTNRYAFSHQSRSAYNFSRISRNFLRRNSFINKLPGLKQPYW